MQLHLCNRAGETPIQIAARFNFAGIVRMLLGMKADVGGLRRDWQFGVLPDEIAQMLAARIDSGPPLKVRQLRAMQSLLSARQVQLELQSHKLSPRQHEATASKPAGVIGALATDVASLAAEPHAKLKALYDTFFILKERVPPKVLVIFYIRAIQRMFNTLEHKVSFAEARQLYDTCPKDAKNQISFDCFVSGLAPLILLLGNAAVPMLEVVSDNAPPSPHDNIGSLKNYPSASSLHALAQSCDQ
jgi:hypothetical protein